MIESLAKCCQTKELSVLRNCIGCGYFDGIAFYGMVVWFSLCAALQMENVESTKDMLRLAMQGRPKFLHFISTMIVVFCCNDGGNIDERVFPTSEQ